LETSWKSAKVQHASCCTKMSMEDADLGQMKEGGGAQQTLTPTPS
jgi:hypothetical protein